MAIPLLTLLQYAHQLIAGGLHLFAAVRDLPADGTPEDRAEIIRLKAQLAATNAAVQMLPILDTPLVTPGPPRAPEAATPDGGP